MTGDRVLRTALITNETAGEEPTRESLIAAANSAAAYQAAAVTGNTAAAYTSAVRHFQYDWGKVLPTTSDVVCDYLAAYAKRLSVRTLEVRLAGISAWHKHHGFNDPTKAHDVKLTMKGIRKLHMKPPKKARPLSLDLIRKIVASLDAEIVSAVHGMQQSESSQGGALSALASGKKLRKRLLKALRDKALVLLGFWRAFRSDELSRITVENTHAIKGEQIEIYLPFSKTDRSASGQTYRMEALRELCPVSAYVDWIEEAGITHGPVFRKIHHWGDLDELGIASKSIGPLLTEMCVNAGLSAASISTHSMRHGFANWAVDQGWDLDSLMKFVGWKSHKNASGYVRAKFDFGALSLAQKGQSGRIHRSEADAQGIGQTFMGISENMDEP